MSSRISQIGSLAAIAALSSLLAATPVLAARPGAADPAPSRAADRMQLAYQRCGHNYHRAPNGSCDPVVDANRDCPDGFHSVPAPNAAGYRCVQNGY
ncbi:MAG TPA: hypothetical protein VKS78_03370 [Roseiarcus sp.]|nr:hypothetical protein [Roseiarcus sp.]